MLRSIIFIFISIFLLGTQSLFAQMDTDKDYIRKNSFYAHWGYNRAHYHNTDISFKGDGFDFSMLDVKAHDDPSPFEADIYLNPTKLTIPQFNFRVGFFISENTSVSFGWDHMKYVIESYQRVKLDGKVGAEFSEEYAGEYTDQGFDLRPTFLEFEHTDGLNYARAAIEHHGNIWNSKNKVFHADAFLGVSGGGVITFTDAHVDGTYYRNWLHLAGWGASAQLGARFRYKDYFYIQYQHQFGYMNLGDIVFMENEARAGHSIRFNEQSLVIGAQIPIFIGGNPNQIAENQ